MQRSLVKGGRRQLAGKPLATRRDLLIAGTLRGGQASSVFKGRGYTTCGNHYLPTNSRANVPKKVAPVDPAYLRYCSMLFKFKSKAAGNLIMLEPSGRRVLEIIGKTPGPKGIILPEEMPGATRALEAAVEREEAEQQVAIDEAKAKGQIPPRGGDVSLRQRALPFLDMLRRSSQAGEVIIWGV
jgi:hypothetical protein